jgi:hypothetical protein
MPGFTGTTFSGTLTIDVTAGTVTALNVSFLGLSPFNTNTNLSGPSSGGYLILAFNESSYSMDLRFTTAPTPGSLVGFTGGTIFEGVVGDFRSNPVYGITGGSITAPAGGVPDGGTTVMLLGAALGVLGVARRFLKA